MIPSFPSEWKTIRYCLPRRTVAAVLWSTLSLRPRSLARDAPVALTGVEPPVVVAGAEHVPARGPCLVACNHYSRPGFDAWWLALAISAAVAGHRAPDADPEIRWVMTAAWTFPESAWRERVLTPITRWAFRRVAQIYGFVSMPPMPPRPDEVEARAAAVRETLRLARRLAQSGGMIGLAPEGQDTAGGLGAPPSGAGRFIARLVQTGLPVLPVGVDETTEGLLVAFGPLFVPMIPENRAEQDREVADQVMEAIRRAIKSP
jgi:1-acyl-sn-glycerol-3-phosphate acyltransferase